MTKSRNDIVNDPNIPSLLDNPEDIQKAIVAAANINNDYASPQATDVMRRLSKTGATLHSFFGLELDKRDAKQLLTYVLQGNEAMALKIAKANPKLFFIKATAKDYAMDLEGNQRTIQDWSPYQALFGTGDKDMLATVKPYLDAHLKTLQDGFDLAANQEQEKFPNGFDFPPSTDEFNKLINELALVIATDPQISLVTGRIKASPATFDLLAKFREHLKPDIVQTGHHFNINNFIKTHEIYNQYFSIYTSHMWKLAFFSLKVIGFQERLMTAPQLDALCMGSNKHINEGTPLTRRFEAMNYLTREKMTIVPFISENPACRLGEELVIDSYRGYGIANNFTEPQQPRLVATWKAMTNKHSEDFKTYAHTKEKRGVKRHHVA